jgi:hypothetical protein
MEAETADGKMVKDKKSVKRRNTLAIAFFFIFISFLVMV